MVLIQTDILLLIKIDTADEGSTVLIETFTSYSVLYKTG